MAGHEPPSPPSWADARPIRIDPVWNPKCRPFSPRTASPPECGNPARSNPTPKPLQATTPSTEVISLYEASKRLELRERSKTNWTPLLVSLCGSAGIDVRTDPSGVPCIRASDLPALGRRVERHLAKPPLWGRRTRKENAASRPKEGRGQSK